jgi:acetate kinase
MASEPLVLNVNKKGANNQYSLYKHGTCKALATTNDGLEYLCYYGTQDAKIGIQGKSTEQALKLIYETWQKLAGKELKVDAAGIKTSFPGGYFLEDHTIDDDFMANISRIKQLAASELESFNSILEAVQSIFKEAAIISVSDSGFHKTKPDYTWNYPIMLDIADNNDIKKFGYDGLALESVCRQLKNSTYKSYQKVIICNLDSNTSVTALYDGKVVDNTFGYSEHDGLIAPRQPGGIDFAAGLALSSSLGMEPRDMLQQTTKDGGLRGLSGLSGDIYELLASEASGNHKAGLALSMYIYSIRQAIAKMAATLEGTELLVFTGEIGTGSSKIRQRIVAGLGFLQFAVNSQLNNKCVNPDAVKPIHPRTRTHPILVIPNLENGVIADHTNKLI